MLHTMLHPFQHFGADTPADGAVMRQATDASTDWQVMEQDGTMMDFGEHTAFLSEADYLGLMEQFPFASLMAYVFRAPQAGAGEAGWRASSRQQVHTPDTALEVIAFVSTFVQTLASVFEDEHRTRHRNFMAHVVRQIAQVCPNTTAHMCTLQARIGPNCIPPPPPPRAPAAHGLNAV